MSGGNPGLFQSLVDVALSPLSIFGYMMLYVCMYVCMYDVCMYVCMYV
jgi:hypothetical protein